MSGPAAPVQVVHLSYLSRSGSTLLARLLQERWRVCVAPEGSLPAELLGVNGFRPPRFGSAAEARAYLGSVLRVSKLGDWGLDLDAVVAGAGPWPMDGPALVAALLAAYRDARAPGDPIVVHKGDPVMPWEVGRALAAAPGAKAVLLVRDPRAVLHSQRTSRYAYAGGAFSHAVAHTAGEWRRLAEAVADPDPRRFWLRYEDLLADQDAALGRLAAFLGAEPREGGAAPDFLGAVAPAERHLHALVAEAPRADRAGRWREGLDPDDADLLQEMLREAMPALGYPLEQRRRPSKAAMAASALRHRGLLLAAKARRHLRTLAGDPGYFLRKAAAKLAGLAGRGAR